jgi:hypothetical protein
VSSEVDPCARTVEWGGATYNLNLNHPWVRRVLNYRGVNGKPTPALLLGFGSGAYSIEDIDRVLELGLVGGGMDEREAGALLDTYVRGKPIATNAGIAAELLGGLFMEKNDDASA